MSILIKRSDLSAQEKQFIKDGLVFKDTKKDDSFVQPFLVETEKDAVFIPMGFYRSLRNTFRPDWPLHPNDARHLEKRKFQFTGTLRDYQAVVRIQGIKYLLENRGFLLGAYCGWGKTIFGAALVADVGLPTLIVYHVSTLNRGWIGSIQNNTNCVVCNLSTDSYNPTADVYVCSISKLQSLTADNRDVFNHIGFLIIDEVDQFCTQLRQQAILCTQPKYILQLTATPDKSNGLSGVIDCYVEPESEKKYRILIPAKRPFHVYKVNTPFRPLITQNKMGGLDWSKVTKSITEKEAYQQMLLDWIIQNPKRKFLVICITVEQVKLLQQKLSDAKEDVGVFYGNMSTYSDCRILLSIDKKAGIGFDDAATCCNFGGKRFDTLMLAWTIKEFSKIEQVIGRLRDDNCTVIDFVHKFSSFEKHYTNRKQWYTSHGGTITEVTDVCVID